MAAPPQLNGPPYGQNEVNGADRLLDEPAERRSADNLPAERNASSSTAPDPGDARVKEVLHSDIGLNLLLERLKQSIATARELASFLSKRSALEEQYAHGLRRIVRATHESLRRGDHRQGSYSQQVDEVNRVHDQTAENGIQFASSLHQMHDDLNAMSVEMERNRKQLKQQGSQAEGRVHEAVTLMEKAKRKYFSLAEDYDRARTGEKTGGFSIRNRSGAQYEEEMQRKVQAADQEYQSRVQSAAAQRQDLLNTGRPQIVTAIQELISECDAAITVQLQKFGAFTEKLLLSNAMLIAPIQSKTDGGAAPARGLREMIQGIDNTKDFNSYVMASSANLPRPIDIKYEPHPSLSSQQQIPHMPMPGGISIGQSSVPGSFSGPQQPQPPIAPQQPYGGPPGQSSFGRVDTGLGSVHQQGPVQQPSYGAPPPQYGQPPHPGQSPQIHSPPYANQQRTQEPSMQRPMQTGQTGTPGQLGQSMPSSQPSQFGQVGQHGQLGQSAQPGQPFQGGPPPERMVGGMSGTNDRMGPAAAQSQSTPIRGPNPPGAIQGAAPRLSPDKPVFGQHLEVLFTRDGEAVPMIVQQCTIAVDLFGAQVEGIYRVSGSAPHIAALKELFDHDSSRVDFRNPESFFHDVNSVAGLLKQFLRDLPDPLFTDAEYPSFINAARIDEDIGRRDAIHASINALPDPNYATLRHLVLHLNKVQQYSHINRMTSNNLAICFGPTVMRSTTEQNVTDAAYAIRVVQTILDHALEIFDDD